MRSYDPALPRRLSRRVRRAVSRRRAGGRIREAGAATVEFALVLTLLVPLMFGIVDYGLWFADSLAVRHGVHEAARVGVVRGATCTTGTTYLDKLVCRTKQQVSAIGGTTYAMAKVPQGWARGKPLVVCAMVKETGVTGVTPLPAGRLVRAKAELAIEETNPATLPLPSGVSGTTAASSADTPPAGADWSWCT